MKSLLTISSWVAILAGVVMVLGGFWALEFTYINVAQEGIITPEDAPLSSKPVRGPLTLKAQADIIREHTLKSTGGQTYAQMPRQVVAVDEQGEEVVGKDGKPVMVPNEAREIWVTATALTTALHLAIITYLFGGMMVLFGAVSIWTGVIFRSLAKK